MISRVSVATLPTPLVAAPRLSEALGLEVWLKRDDLTGLGLGGNKARPLDYLLGDALAQGADHFVTGGGPGSNWVLLAATAALSRGLRVEVVLFGGEDAPEVGCLRLLKRLPGVGITFTGDPARHSVDPQLETVSSQLRGLGHRPYTVGRGGAGPVGALGYVTAVDEMDSQLDGRGVEASTVWLATGSCGTQAGLVAGHRRPGQRRRHIVGVSVHRPLEECRQRIVSMSEAALDLLEVEVRPQVDWTVLDALCPEPEQVDSAARLMIGTEGVYVDREFGAAALAALTERADEVKGPVVFVVTGGAPSLFAGSAVT